MAGKNSTPDVRVRLSAEGVQDVVAAFRQISSEANNSARKTEQGVNMLTKLNLAQWAMRAASYVKDFALTSLDAQEGLSKLHKQTGMSVETLSVLARTVKLADGDLGDLYLGFKKINSAISALVAGDRGARNLFSGLNLSAKDFIGLNPDQKFLLVATALGRIADEDDRARIATELFGRSTGAMMIVADDLAKNGFAKLNAETDRLNQKFGGDNAAAAEHFNDTLKDIKLRAEALAGKGILGISNAMEWCIQKTRELSGELATVPWLNVIPGMQLLGLLGLVNGEAEKRLRGAQSAYQTSGGLMASHSRGGAEPLAISHSAEMRAQEQKDRAKVNATEQAEATKQGAALAKIRADAAKAGADHILAIRNLELAREQAQDDAAFSQGLMSVDEYYSKRATRISAGLDAEVAALKSKRAAAVKENNAQLAAIDGEIGKQRALNGVLADTTELENQRAQVALTGQGKVKELDNQIAQARKKSDNEQLQNTLNKGAADIDLAKERLSLEQRIAEAQGDTYTAAIKGIQAEATELAKALRVSVEDPRVKQLIALLTGQAMSDNFARQFQMQMRGFDLNTNAFDIYQQQLQQRVNSGAMFPAQAQAAYSATVKAQLPVLQEQLNLLRDAAKVELESANAALNSALAQGQDTAAKREAVLAATEHAQALEQEQLKLDELKLSADFAAQQMSFFKTSMQEAITTDLAGWLSSGIDKATGLGDAVRGLALSLVQSMRNILAQILANVIVYKTLVAILGKDKADDLTKAGPQLMVSSVMMAVGGSIVKQAANALQAASIELMAAAVMLMVANSMSGGGGQLSIATGGYIRGPGTGTSDSIPAWVSNGEYVIKASAVRRVGVDTLDAINRGTRPVDLERWQAPRFADGGLVEIAQPGQSRPDGLDVMLGLDEGLLLKRLEKSRAFGRVVVKHVGGNRNAVNNALGRGGR